MPYIEAAERFEEGSLVDLNYRKLFGQVRTAMKKEGPARDAALIDIVMRNYPSIGKEQRRIDRQTRAKLAHTGDESLNEIIAKASRPTILLERYVDLIAAMAKDVDKTYNPGMMLGMQRTAVEDLVKADIASYTKNDAARYTMFDLVDRNEVIDEIRAAKVNNKGEAIKYSTALPNQKGYIKEAYIRGELMRERLNSKGFFWKLFHRRQVNEMRSFIAEVEDTLRAVEFPDDAKTEARQEFATSSAHPDELKAEMRAIPELYVPLETKLQNKLFDIDFIPDLDMSLAQQCERAENLYNDYVKGNPNAPEGVKDVLLANRAKIVKVQEDIKASRDAGNLTYTSNSKLIDEFTKGNIEMWKKYPKYSAPRVEALAEDKTRREAEQKVNAEQQKFADLKNQMFKIDYKPDVVNINQHIKASNELYQQFVKNNPAIPEDAKAVFNANRAKISKIQSMIKESKAKGAMDTQEISETINDFSINDKKLADQYPDYKAPAVEELPKVEQNPIVGEEKDREPIKVDLDEGKKEEKIEPKKDDLEKIKDPVAKGMEGV